MTVSRDAWIRLRPAVVEFLELMHDFQHRTGIPLQEETQMHLARIEALMHEQDRLTAEGEEVDIEGVVTRLAYEEVSAMSEDPPVTIFRVHAGADSPVVIHTPPEHVCVEGCTQDSHIASMPTEEGWEIQWPSMEREMELEYGTFATQEPERDEEVTHLGVTRRRSQDGERDEFFYRRPRPEDYNPGVSPPESEVDQYAMITEDWLGFCWRCIEKGYETHIPKEDEIGLCMRCKDELRNL